jgi:hypothetical protein
MHKQLASAIRKVVSACPSGTIVVVGGLRYLAMPDGSLRRLNDKRSKRRNQGGNNGNRGD